MRNTKKWLRKHLMASQLIPKCTGENSSKHTNTNQTIAIQTDMCLHLLCTHITVQNVCTCNRYLCRIIYVYQFLRTSLHKLHYKKRQCDFKLDYFCYIGITIFVLYSLIEIPGTQILIRYLSS